MAVFSAIDATERATGASSIMVRASIEFENRENAVQVRNIYAGEGGSAMVAAMNTAVPLSYLMQSGFETDSMRRTPRPSANRPTSFRASPSSSV